MRSSSLPLKHRVVSNLVNNLIMSSWFDQKESFDGEKTSARVMRACDGNPTQSALVGCTIFETISHDETGPFFGECVYIVNIAFSA